MNTSAGINGFGRFGLHLLKKWLDDFKKSTVEIKYINDEKLNTNKIFNLIKNDYKLSFQKYKFKKINKKTLSFEVNRKIFFINITKSQTEKIPWIGKPNLFFECSGRNLSKKKYLKVVKNNTKLVIISATSWDCDKTLIASCNDNEFNFKKHKVISYGSCTVNAFVPFASVLNQNFGINKSSINVIHNVPKYKLNNFNTLHRKFCTLELMGPKLLSFINKNNFNVNYTMVPYSGVSIMDFHFTLKKKINSKNIINFLNKKKIKKLYKLIEFDNGPDSCREINFNAVFIKNSIKIKKNDLYIQSYFDNENSAYQFYVLVKKIVAKLK